MNPTSDSLAESSALRRRPAESKRRSAHALHHPLALARPFSRQTPGRRRTTPAWSLLCGLDLAAAELGRLVITELDEAGGIHFDLGAIGGADRGCRHVKLPVVLDGSNDFVLRHETPFPSLPAVLLEMCFHHRATRARARTGAKRVRVS